MAIEDQVVAEAKMVQEALGPGHRENAYHEALATGLSERGIRHTTEATGTITYRGVPVARIHPDLILQDDENDRTVIVEIKVDSDGTDQLRRYLDNMEADCGLMLSFGEELEYTELSVTPP